MSFAAQTKHHWVEFPCNERYTSFKLDLTEYRVFQQFYQQLKNTFIISNTDHECHLQWTTKSVYSSEYKRNLDQAVVLVDFPEDCNFEGMKIVVSIINNNGTKIISKSSMKGYASSLTIAMTDENDPYSSVTILENYLHDGTLTLFCELIHAKITRNISMSIDNTHIHAASFYNNVAKEFKELFENGDLCDFTIVVEDAEFHAHKIVLAANSPVFDAMFTTGMKEQIENTVTITDINAATFKAFLIYMYTGTVERNSGLVHDLLMVADKYEVVSLMNLCKAYKANELNNRNQHYWRQCPNRKELTSIVRNLKRFGELREFHLTSSPFQFVITNTEYNCELRIKHYRKDICHVYVSFPKDCKLILKVIVSFVDEFGKKLKTQILMKPEQAAYLKFSMDDYNLGIHSQSSDLTIVCEIIYVDLTPIKSTAESEGELQDETLSNSIKKKIELLFNDKCFCDVTVVVEDAQIHAHKIVLAANSPVFKAMFSKNAVEQIGNTFTIEDSNATTVKALLTFMYTGTIERTEQRIRDLLILAKKYQVLELVTLCENYEQKYLNTDNVNALIACASSEYKLIFLV